jgi:hypothetical protein
VNGISFEGNVGEFWQCGKIASGADFGYLVVAEGENLEIGELMDILHFCYVIIAQI